MKSIKFENGDMVFQYGQLLMVEDLEQKIQKTRCLLKTSLGELFYNTNLGLDFKKILSIDKMFLTDENKKMAIRECLSKDENIEQIQTIDIIEDVKKRKVEIVLKIKYKNETETVEIGGLKFE